MEVLERLNKTARSDYAGSMGSVLPELNFALGPNSYEEGDRWQNGTDPMTSWIASENNGVIYQRSEVKPAMITDGLSKTFLIGEKYVPHNYLITKSHGDDQSVYVGFSFDNNRSGNYSIPPTHDIGEPGRHFNWRFGSAHSSGFYMAHCDGSVHRVDYDIDMTVFSEMSARDQARREPPD